MNTSWLEHAACCEPGVDPELFFPLGESGPAARQIADAKAICAQCPVAAQCRDWALRTGEPDGIWGGTTPEERRRRGAPGTRRPTAKSASGFPAAVPTRWSHNRESSWGRRTAHATELLPDRVRVLARVTLALPVDWLRS